MFLSRNLAVGIILALCAISFQLAAQEPGMPAPGGRGGRGQRAGRGADGTHEFLGLGAPPDADAAAKGAPLYKQNCGGCHGDNARGGQAPNLVRSVIVLHDENDEQVGPIVKNGRSQAGMPAFANLSQNDIHNITQYLKMQVELAANRGTYGQTFAGVRNQLTGNAKDGEAFFRANCTGCHSAAGDLAKVGAKYPEASAMQPRFLWPARSGPRQAEVVTNSGEKIKGAIREMDDFGISLVDTSGEYHYWSMDQVKVHVEDKLAGHRALLPKYTDKDIHDLTAYLVTLK